MCRQPPRPSPRTRGAAGPPPLLQRPRSGAQGGLLPALLWERAQPPPWAGARGTPRPEPRCGSRARRQQPPLVGLPGGPRAAAGQPWCTGVAGQCCCRHTRCLCTGEFWTAEPPPGQPPCRACRAAPPGSPGAPPEPYGTAPQGCALRSAPPGSLWGVREPRAGLCSPSPEQAACFMQSSH